ncbi:MAG: hypothetical protein ACTSQ8_13685 [Candidatus Helarchaeota archaeon]
MKDPAEKRGDHNKRAIKEMKLSKQELENLITDDDLIRMGLK